MWGHDTIIETEPPLHWVSQITPVMSILHKASSIGVCILVTTYECEYDHMCIVVQLVSACDKKNNYYKLCVNCTDMLVCWHWQVGPAEFFTLSSWREFNLKVFFYTKRTRWTPLIINHLTLWINTLKWILY